jgi:hypothetical protein
MGKSLRSTTGRRIHDAPSPVPSRTRFGPPRLDAPALGGGRWQTEGRRIGATMEMIRVLEPLEQSKPERGGS